MAFVKPGRPRVKRTLCVSLAVFLVLSFLATRAACLGAAASEESSAPTEVPLTIVEGVPMVRGAIQGRDIGLFVVNPLHETEMVLDCARADDLYLHGELGHPRYSQPFGRERRQNLLFPLVKPLRVGNRRLGTGTVPAMRLTTFASGLGVRISGSVHPSFFGTEPITLDYDNGKMLINPDYRASASSRAVECVAGFTGKGVHIAASLNGQPGWFQLAPLQRHTCAVSNRKCADILVSGPQTVTYKPVIVESTGPQPRRALQVRLESLRVGTLDIPEPLATIVKPPEDSDPQYSGVLGAYFLRRFKVTLDPTEGIVVLDPGKRFAERDKADKSGLYLLGVDGDWHVGWVEDGGPGDSAGIRPGDSILEADGTPAADLSLEELRELLRSEEGRVIPLKLERSRQEFDVELKLQDRFKPSASPLDAL